MPSETEFFRLRQQVLELLTICVNKKKSWLAHTLRHIPSKNRSLVHVLFIFRARERDIFSFSVRMLLVQVLHYNSVCCRGSSVNFDRHALSRCLSSIRVHSTLLPVSLKLRPLFLLFLPRRCRSIDECTYTSGV